MKIYIVIHGTNYEGFEIKKIFRDKKDAEDWLKDNPGDIWTDYSEVQEHEIQEEEDALEDRENHYYDTRW